jgi:hypothetical protein
MQAFIYMRIHSPLWRTHAHPTPMSTFERLSRQIGSWDWRSHHWRLAIDGNVASHWKNILPLWDTQMSNLRFELWWARGTNPLLTTQPQVDSPGSWWLWWCTTMVSHGARQFRPWCATVVSVLVGIILKWGILGLYQSDAYYLLLNYCIV